MCLAPSDIHKARTQSLFSAGLVSLRHKATQTARPNRKAAVSYSLTPHAQSRKLLQAHSLPAVPSHCQSHRATASGLTRRAWACSCCPAQPKQLGGICEGEEVILCTTHLSLLPLVPTQQYFKARGTRITVNSENSPPLPRGGKKKKKSACQNRI